MNNSNDTSTVLYLDLMEKVLSDFHRYELGEAQSVRHITSDEFKFKVAGWFDTLIRMINKNSGIYKEKKYILENRLEGKDWPVYADTMIGLKRLKNIRNCAEEVISNKIEGDFIETGVWRGGSTIFMKAILKAYNISDKNVWVADSFEGLPKPNEEKYAADKGDKYHTFKELAIPLEQVKYNFEKYGLLDDKVKFLKGWFKDTMPVAPIQKLSLLRLDGDMYESTIDVLKYLYSKLSIGGFIIIDDYAIPGCKAAVDDYRREHNITEPIQVVDWTGVYWKKLK